jgi:hypothetical protein
MTGNLRPSGQALALSSLRPDGRCREMTHRGCRRVDEGDLREGEAPAELPCTRTP